MNKQDILQEKDIIPYQPSDIPDGPWIVLSPHPDDETFGLGGTIAIGRSKGVDIKVIQVTSGDKGGDPLEREKESLKALSILGVEENSVIFWRFPDRGLVNFLKEITDGVIKAIGKFSPKVIFAPSPVELHPDHRVVAKAAFKAFKKSGFKGQLWFYEVSRHSEVNRLIVIDTVLQKKVEAMSVYKSQLAQKPYIDITLSINRSRALTLDNSVSTVEAFWALGRESFLPFCFIHYLATVKPSLSERFLSRLMKWILSIW